MGFSGSACLPGIQRTVAIAVAPGRALAAAFVATRADQAINVGLHDQLQHVLGDGAQKSGWPPFAASSSISNLSSVIGNSSSSRLKCANSTITMNPVATSDAAFRGGHAPTPEYTIAYTGTAQRMATRDDDPCIRRGRDQHRGPSCWEVCHEERRSVCAECGAAQILIACIAHFIGTIPAGSWIAWIAPGDHWHVGQLAGPLDQAMAGKNLLDQ